ncbi:TPA: 50S ribosomal protein L15 [Candidatus Dependentiae bacterium]|nr:50S ribosomal protein L15 [Candidatus Dependentiae bacterium]HBZ73468.1 50S ribosomal protein L15 [Candidatus Dependentiae bacterium]
MQLNKLNKLKKDRKVVGRGGDLGGTSTRGHKGQKARSGAHVKAFFEGGQMPISRRLPKRGFVNAFKKEVCCVNICDLELKFNSGEIVNLVSLTEKGLVKGRSKSMAIKILGKGTLSKKLVVHADMFSKSAIEAIEKSGGAVNLIKENSSGSSAS